MNFAFTDGKVFRITKNLENETNLEFLAFVRFLEIDNEDDILYVIFSIIL